MLHSHLACCGITIHLVTPSIFAAVAHLLAVSSSASVLGSNELVFSLLASTFAYLLGLAGQSVVVSFATVWGRPGTSTEGVTTQAETSTMTPERLSAALESV